MKSKESQHYIMKLGKIPTPYSTEISGIKLRIDHGVYPPGSLGELFGKALEHPDYGIKPGNIVLDYGTGSGLLSIFAAKLGSKKVIATDINDKAISCAAYNFKQNKVEDKIEVRLGDSFSCIKEEEKFDLIMASLPWENAEPNPDVPLEQSFYDKDFKMRKTLFTGAKKHLTENGHTFFSYSKKAQEREPIEKYIEGFEYSIVAQADIEDEPHYIYDIKKNKQ